MKRIGNVWDDFCSVDLIKTAIRNAAKGKRKYRKVRKVLANIDDYAEQLHKLLVDEMFSPSPYTCDIMKTEYGKEREIFKLPFFPDRVVQHCISLVLRDRWTKSFTSDSYACLVGRGINCKQKRYNLNHKLKRAIESYPPGVRLYALQMDIRKCYPTVDNKLLAEINRKYCKDEKMLALLDMLNFNEGSKGLPIGNFLSQLWINIVLTLLDRYIKEVLKAEDYFRYMDDMVLISDDKHKLHEWKWRIMNFVFYVLHQEINGKRQVYPIGESRAERGIDFAGYVYRRGFTLVRKRIKQSFARKRRCRLSVPSYVGIVEHCDGKNLIRKLTEGNNMAFSDLGRKIERPFEGDNIKIDQVVDRPIELLDFEVRPSEKKAGTDYVKLQIRFEGRKRFIGGGYQFLADFLKTLPPARELKKLPLGQGLPQHTVIRNKRGYYFNGTIDE